MRILSGKMLVLAVVLALVAYGAVRKFGGSPSLMMASGEKVSGKAIRQPVTVQPLAVIFDLDDTLVAFDAVSEPSWVQVCRQMLRPYRSRRSSG